MYSTYNPKISVCVGFSFCHEKHKRPFILSVGGWGLRVIECFPGTLCRGTYSGTGELRYISGTGEPRYTWWEYITCQSREWWRAWECCRGTRGCIGTFSQHLFWCFYCSVSVDTYKYLYRNIVSISTCIETLHRRCLQSSPAPFCPTWTFILYFPNAPT